MASSYLNNPSLVLSKHIPLNSSESTLQSSIISIIHDIVDESSHWSKVTDGNDVKVEKLTGGITNALYLVQHTTLSSAACAPLIMRLFGEGTEVIIDRNMENIVFASLSKLQRLPTPIFYGLFQNGRVEGYLPNSITCEPVDLYYSTMMPLIADTVAKFHQINLSSIPHHEILWSKLDKLFYIALNVEFDDVADMEKHRDLNVQAMKLEYDRFRAYITTATANSDDNKLLSYHQLGQAFGKEVVLCHNDLLCGNILHLQDTNQIVLIDYEYCGYNFRAYDIANHFCEYCGFDFDIHNNFPSDDLRKTFLEAYLASFMKNIAAHVDSSTSCTQLSSMQYRSEEWNEFVQGFDMSIKEFTAASHFFWGTWSIVQAKMSSIDFDYIGYAKLRYDGYQYHKQLFSYPW